MNIDPRPEFGSFAFAGARGCVLRKSKCAKSYLEVSFCSIMLFDIALAITFGGMWRWRRVAVARVFALVVRCRIIRLLLYSRVGKNRDTRRESPAGAGAGRGASHKTASLFTQLSRHGAPMTYTDLL